MQDKPYKHYSLVLLFGIVFLLIISILANVSIILFFLFESFFFIFLYVLFKLRDQIYVLFLTSFFTFLLGREFIFEYLDKERYYIFSSEIENHAYFSLILSLWIIFITYLFMKNSNIKLRNRRLEEKHFLIVARVSRSLFFICYPFLIVFTYMEVTRTNNLGYLQTYVASNVGWSTSATMISIIGNISLFAMYVYLMSFPSKKTTVIIAFMYLAYGFLTVFTGKRAEFVCNVFTLIVYLDLRYKKLYRKKWINKKIIVTGIILIPILIYGLYQFDFIRSNKTNESGFSDALISFFDQQGGSINVLKWGKYYEDSLPENKLYSFATIDSNIRGNILFRRIFRTKVYYGNSIEHALFGSSMADSLSFLIYGDYYLRGRGIGSCYIAENYHDLGYFGIILGSVAYAFLLILYRNSEANNLLFGGIKLLSLNAFFITPRAAFDYPIGILLNYGNLGGFLLIVIISNIILGRIRRHE